MTTRPVGRPRKHRVKIGLTLRQDNAEYLAAKKAEGHDKSLIVDKALDNLKGEQQTKVHAGRKKGRKKEGKR